MDDPLISEVLDQLDGATVSDAIENLVLGALLGRMTEVVDGIRVERPAAAVGDEPTPVRAYLESVAVTGFRGVGPTSGTSPPAGPGPHTWRRAQRIGQVVVRGSRLIRSHR